MSGKILTYKHISLLIKSFIILAAMSRASILITIHSSCICLNYIKVYIYTSKSVWRTNMDLYKKTSKIYVFFNSLFLKYKCVQSTIKKNWFFVYKHYVTYFIYIYILFFISFISRFYFFLCCYNCIYEIWIDKRKKMLRWSFSLVTEKNVMN